MIMTLIVVAIDFSKTSLHALDYAINIANSTKADVMMVWVDNQTSNESIFSDGGCEIREESKRNFEELHEQLKGRLVHGKLRYKLKKGKVYFEIAQQAKRYKADLIVAGTHGVTGFEEFWIGSNAYRIVINAPCPVITVRHNFDLTKKIQKIIIPIDNTRNTIQKVPYIARVAKSFDSEVHILALYSTVIKAIRNKVDIAANEAKVLMEKLKINCILESMMAENVTQCTLNYASRIDAELISIMTEQETTEANILLGEYARQMVNNSPIPVISIHPNEIWTFEKR